MFWTYIKIAFRNFRKNRLLTFINVLGLAVGISAALMVFAFVHYDFDFDKWEPDHGRIYRVYTKYGDNFYPGINLLAPKAIEQNVSGIETVAHFREADFLRYANLSQTSKIRFINSWGRTGFVNERFFAIFPHKWLVGGPSDLAGLNTIVLSISEVKRFFPGLSYQQAIGRVITFNDSIRLTVKGIVADLKEHSDYNYKNFISLNTFMETSLDQNDKSDNWYSVNSLSQCFIKLDKGVQVSSVARRIKSIYLKNVRDVDDQERSFGLMQTLSNVHFKSRVDGVVDKATLVKLGGIAVLLLLLAVFNFINLSSAQSALRAKEVGVRKTFGSGKKEIVFQFLTETFLLTLVATLLAVLFMPLLFCAFGDFVPDGFSLGDMLNPVQAIFLVFVVIVVGIVAGLYPAFILTRYKPAAVLKGAIRNIGEPKSIQLRQVLTVIQFVIAQVFLILMVVVGKQIHFMLQKDLGLKDDAIITFTLPLDLRQNDRNGQIYMAFLRELRRNPAILNVSISSGTPLRSGYSSSDITVFNSGKQIILNNVHTRSVDEHYISLFDLHLLAGRNVKVSGGSTVGEALINQTMVAKLGVKSPEAVIGHEFLNSSGDTVRIVGILRDFATQNLHSAISPTIVYGDDQRLGKTVAVLLNRQNVSGWSSCLELIGREFKKTYPKAIFDYIFYDQSIKHLYQFDLRISTLLKWATGLAIFISCLGLLGLVSFMANQRTKEIGIRKVLGASVANILGLLSGSLIKLVLLATVISFPFAWYFSHKWLQDFAFKTNIGWVIFAICAVGMLLIALTVLWLRTFKAAKANPVQSLRDE